MTDEIAPGLIDWLDSWHGVCVCVFRYTFRSKYLNVIDFVFGNTGHKIQKIRHVPSTSDLARQYFRPKSLKREKESTNKEESR